MLPQQYSIAMNMRNVPMIDIYFKNLSYEVQTGYRKSNKQILNNLNGVFKAGELTAIMGPSGSGKSTLLNVLNGISGGGRLTGTIEYVGRNSEEKLQDHKKQSCYIQQMDYLHGLFTVQESMMIATQLKISNSMKEKQTQVDNILNMLNLVSAKNTPVEQLSGGQKKRLSIALELIDNLPVMFLDEPTSGLDSLSSLQCISTLKSLTKCGRTIICSIHQPSAVIYQLFDYIYLVADGQCLYAGTPDNTINYFTQQGFQCPKYHNPADYMLEVINREYGIYDKQQMIVAASYYCQRDEPKERPTKKSSFNENMKQLTINPPPSEITRCWILISRYAILLHRDWMTMHLRIIINFFTAILLGLVYEKAGQDAEKIYSNASFLEICIIYMTYTTMMPAVLKFPTDICILRKERFNNWYQLRTYYVAILAISILTHTFFTLIYSSTAYFLSSQPLEVHRFLMFLVIMIMTTFVAESIGLCLGTVYNPLNGTFFGAIIMATMAILNGFFCFFDHMSRILYYLSYLSFFRFSFDGLMQAIYGYQREKLTCTKQYCHYQMPRLIMKEMSMLEPTFWLDVIVLIGWFAIIRVLVYVTLKRHLSNM